MRIEDLEYLVVIAEEKALNGAAKRLKVSHQSLGETMTNMEKELGVKILIRTPRGISLTKAGEEMVEFAKHTVMQYKKVRKKISSNLSVEEPLQELNIYASARFCEAVLFQYVEKFRAIYPQEKINIFADIVSNVFGRVASDLANNKSVVGFTIIKLSKKNETLKLLESYGEKFHPLVRSELVFLVGRDHPLAQTSEERVANILSYPLIHFGHDVEYADKFLQDFGNYTPEIVTASYNVWCSILRENEKVGYMYDYFLNEKSSLNKSLTEQFAVVRSKEKMIADIGYVLSDDPNELEKRFAQFLTLN